MREKDNSPILGTSLDSHCGKAVLSVAVGGQGEVIRHYRYDIDTGQPVSGEWWDSLSLENLDYYTSGKRQQQHRAQTTQPGRVFQAQFPAVLPHDIIDNGQP